MKGQFSQAAKVSTTLRAVVTSGKMSSNSGSKKAKCKLAGASGWSILVTAIEPLLAKTLSTLTNGQQPSKKDERQELMLAHHHLETER